MNGNVFLTEEQRISLFNLCRDIGLIDREQSTGFISGKIRKDLLKQEFRGRWSYVWISEKGAKFGVDVSEWYCVDKLLDLLSPEGLDLILAHLDLFK